MIVAVSPQPPAQVVDQRPRCWRCGKVFADFTGRPWQFTCPRCKAVNQSPAETRAA